MLNGRCCSLAAPGFRPRHTPFASCLLCQHQPRGSCREGSCQRRHRISADVIHDRVRRHVIDAQQAARFERQVAEEGVCSAGGVRHRHLVAVDHLPRSGRWKGSKCRYESDARTCTVMGTRKQGAGCQSHQRMLVNQSCNCSFQLRPGGKEHQEAVSSAWILLSDTAPHARAGLRTMQPRSPNHRWQPHPRRLTMHPARPPHHPFPSVCLTRRPSRSQIALSAPAPSTSALAHPRVLP